MVDFPILDHPCIHMVVVDHMRRHFNEVASPSCKALKMGKTFLSLFLATFLAFSVQGLEIESPQFTPIHSESEFEIRLYRESSWMSALVQDISFEKSTRGGFHRLFQYIQGANLNFSRIPMTAPVLTSIVPGAGPLHSSGYIVRFYLPTKFQGTPPLPLPELDLQAEKWESRCVAVRKFSGFARDSNIVKEAESLAISLGRSPWANSTTFDEDKYAYSIAQYNSPFRFIGRTNEVWVDVDGPQGGCPTASRVSSY